METLPIALRGGSGTVPISIGSGSGTLHIGLSRAGGTNRYPALLEKPSIEGHVLVGDSTLPEIGVGDITPQDIDRIIYD